MLLEIMYSPKTSKRKLEPKYGKNKLESKPFSKTMTN
jgi:hypothetical protein